MFLTIAPTIRRRRTDGFRESPGQRELSSGSGRCRRLCAPGPSPAACDLLRGAPLVSARRRTCLASPCAGPERLRSSSASPPAVPDAPSAAEDASPGLGPPTSCIPCDGSLPDPNPHHDEARRSPHGGRPAAFVHVSEERCGGRPCGSHPTRRHARSSSVCFSLSGSRPSEAMTISLTRRNSTGQRIRPERTLTSCATSG